MFAHNSTIVKSENMQSGILEECVFFTYMFLIYFSCFIMKINQDFKYNNWFVPFDKLNLGQEQEFILD